MTWLALLRALYWIVITVTEPVKSNEASKKLPRLKLGTKAPQVRKQAGQGRFMILLRHRVVRRSRVNAGNVLCRAWYFTSMALNFLQASAGLRGDEAP